MAKPKKKPTVVVQAVDEYEPTPRDFVMARMAAARAAAQSAITAIDDALNLFVNPDQDRKGKERTEMVGEALEALGCACRALEMGEAALDQVDMEEPEPWDEDDDEDDEDDEDEDDAD